MSTKKKKKYSKKKKNRMKKFILLLFIIIGITVFTMITPVFNIEEINVKGNSKIDNQTIISLSGLTKGENIFRNLKLTVENNIKENSYIKEVKMKRILPRTIEFDIEERKIAYQIELIDAYIYIDNQGYILENSTKKENVPVLQGMTTSQDEILNSKRLNMEDLNKLNTIIKIMDSVKSIEIQEKITSINATDTNEYILHLKEENKYVYIGNESNLNNKMLYVQIMLKEEKGNKGKIFVNGDLNNGFKPFFRDETKNRK